MIKKIYKLSTQIYALLTSFFENILLRNRNFENIINKEGYKNLLLIKPLNLNINSNQKISVNKYMDKILLKQHQIINIINHIFIKSNFKSRLYQLTGFKFNIGFMLLYSTKNVAAADQHKNIYANQWHKDLPFSKNTIKIIIPIAKIEKEDGGIEIRINKEFIYKMVCKKGDTLVFNPNLFYHKAGNPKKNRIQIMLQLNPSKYWSYNDDLEKLQKKLEPKFPHIAFIFKKKVFI